METDVECVTVQGYPIRFIVEVLVPNSVLQIRIISKTRDFGVIDALLFLITAIFIAIAKQDRPTRASLATVLCALCAVALWWGWGRWNAVKEDNVMFFKGHGIQLTTKYRHFGREKTCFIERANVIDLVINEAIHLHRVVFYMAVMVRQQSQAHVTSPEKMEFTDRKLALVFPHFLPRLPELRRVYLLAKMLL